MTVIMLCFVSFATSALGGRHGCCWYLFCCGCCSRCCSADYCIICQKIADASDRVNPDEARKFCEDCWPTRNLLNTEITSPYLTERVAPSSIVDASSSSARPSTPPPRRSEAEPLLAYQHVQSPGVRLILTPKHEGAVEEWVGSMRIRNLVEALVRAGRAGWTEGTLKGLIEEAIRTTRRPEQIPEIAQLWIPGMAFIGWKARRIPIEFADSHEAELVSDGLTQQLRTVQHVMLKAFINRVRYSDTRLRRESYDPQLNQIIRGETITFVQRRAEPYDYYDSVLYLSATGYACFSDVRNAEWYRGLMARPRKWQIKMINVDIHPDNGHNPGPIWLVCPR